MRSVKNLPIYTAKNAVFYGWWLVLITLFLNATTGSPVFGGVGVWVDAFENEFGWSRAQLSLAFSIGQLEGSVVGPLVGIVVDRVGPRKVVLAGVLIIGVGFLILTRTESLLMFYVSYAVIMLGASGGGWLPMMTVLNNWFDRKRTMAMGIGGIGFSLGSFLLVPALAWMVVPDNAGWRLTSLGLGLFFIIIAFPVSRLIRNTPEEYGDVPDGMVEANPIIKSTNDSSNISKERDYSIVEVLKIPAFWIISICHACSTMLIGTMTVHLILALKDQGISVQVGALIWGSTMGFSGIAQVFGGWMGDKVPKNVALGLLGCLQSVGVIFSTFLTSVYLAPIFIVVYGIGFGARIPLGTAIRGEYFGRKAFGKVLGLSMMPMSLMMMLGPLIAGKMYDIQGTYDYAFYILSGVAITGSLGFFFAKKPNTIPR